MDMDKCTGGANSGDVIFIQCNGEAGHRPVTTGIVQAPSNGNASARDDGKASRCNSMRDYRFENRQWSRINLTILWVFMKLGAECQWTQTMRGPEEA
jgi:hypothetical protein